MKVITDAEWCRSSAARPSGWVLLQMLTGFCGTCFWSLLIFTRAQRYAFKSSISWNVLCVMTGQKPATASLHPRLQQREQRHHRQGTPALSQPLLFLGSKRLFLISSLVLVLFSSLLCFPAHKRHSALSAVSLPHPPQVHTSHLSHMSLPCVQTVYINVTFFESTFKDTPAL